MIERPDPVYAFQLVLQHCQTLSRALMDLPDTSMELRHILEGLDDEDEADIDSYLGQAAMIFGHLRERFLVIRHLLGERRTS